MAALPDEDMDEVADPNPDDANEIMARIVREFFLSALQTVYWEMVEENSLPRDSRAAQMLLNVS